VTAVCIMVLGTTSGAGKSWLTTALCRHYARQGLKVAPFKAQNMSNNARVVAPTLHRSRGPFDKLRTDGLPPEGADAPWGGPAENRLPVPDASFGEIGSAQYFQALAARAEPEVRMNPLLLKPEADTHSQVVLLGQVSRELSAMPWRGRSEKVWPAITHALDELREAYDVIVIEGAGSPAEINLHASDIVNMRIARHAQARCLLVTDIDRGGAFAHLYGTWALLPEEERALIHGFVLNKFRGDADLLAPGPQMLQDLTGVPTVATLPMWWQHGLPEEDGVFDDRTRASGRVEKTIAVIAYPRLSNLDEFQPLKNVPGVRLVWARTPADCAGAHWLILPGSKATCADLAWLREQGLDRAVAEHAGRGGAVLGICGGLQMLGEALIDTDGVEPMGLGNAPGLGLLPLVTLFEPLKTVRHAQACFGELVGPWSALTGVAVTGYEIHHGQTAQHPAMAAAGDVAREVLPGLGWQNTAGNVLGVYLHGLFEDPAVLHALFGASTPTLDTVFDGLADFIEQHFEADLLRQLIQTKPDH
jgi:adenosylcobyric acid synthase